MKKIITFTLFCVFIYALSTQSYASEINNEVTSSLQNELGQFKNSLPEYVQDFFPNGILDGDFTSLINGELNEGKFLDQIGNYLIIELDSVFKSFASVLILIIISGLFNTLSATMLDVNISNTFSICSTLCISITVFNLCNILASNVTHYIQLLCNVMNAFLPIMIALLTISGNISSAVVSNGSMLLFISIVQGFLVTFMLPLTKICLVFSCIKGFGGPCDLSGISKTLKNTFTSAVVFVMSIFMFVLSYKNTLSQSVDSISLKTARFAISSLVPLVGSSVNEALRTVTSSLSLIKKSCGIVAIIIIAVMMLPLIVNLLLNKLSFNFLSSFSKALGNGNESHILEEADHTCGFLLTIVACTCVLFIFALTIFIKTSIEVGI